MVSALASAAGLLQKERDRGRVVVEGASGWPAAYPGVPTGPSIGWVQVTNRTTQPIQITGLGFSVGGRAIALGNTNQPMPAYLLVGQSVTGFCSLYELARATDLKCDGAYAHLAGMDTVRAKVVPRRLFTPLMVERAA